MKVKIIALGVLATLLLATSVSASTGFGHTNIYLADGTYYGFHNVNDVEQSGCGVRGVCYTAYVPYYSTDAKRIHRTQASIKSTDTIIDYEWEEYVDYSPWWVDQTNTPVTPPYYTSNYAYQLGEIDLTDCEAHSYLRILYQKSNGLWYRDTFRVANLCPV